MSTNHKTHVETSYRTSSREPNKADTFNKSRRIIEGLMAKSPVMERRVLSYDSDYGIYRTLSNALYSQNTPQYVINHIRDLASGQDPVSYLATDLVAKGLFTPEKLNSCAAKYDASFFSLVKTAATRYLIDLARKLKNRQTVNLEDPVGAGNSPFTLLQKMAADKNLSVESHMAFEDLDLLEDIGLNTFQKHICIMLEAGYEPEEIVHAYATLNDKPSYKKSYCYSQKSLAASKIKAVIKK